MRAGDGCHGDSDQVGRLIPQPKLSDGVWLDDHVGTEFCLLIDAELLSAMRHELAPQIARRGIVCVDSSNREVADWLAALGHKAVLARPDRYVFGAVNDAKEVTALVAACRPKSVEDHQRTTDRR